MRRCCTRELRRHPLRPRSGVLPFLTPTSLSLFSSAPAESPLPPEVLRAGKESRDCVVLPTPPPLPGWSEVPCPPPVARTSSSRSEPDRTHEGADRDVCWCKSRRAMRKAAGEVHVSQ